MVNSELIKALRQAGIKHNPDDIVAIEKCPDGKIVFIETGNSRAGLKHICEKHGSDFEKRGIPADQIASAVITAASQGVIAGTQGTSRTIYKVQFEEQIQYISIDLGSNGFVVGANPTARRLIERLQQGGERA